MTKMLGVSVLVLFVSACSTPASNYVKGDSNPAAERMAQCRLAAEQEYMHTDSIIARTVGKQGYVDDCMRAAGYVPAK